MYFTSEFCYVCMKCEKKMCRLSDIGTNNITYYKKLLSILPELNKETMNQFRHICEGCSRLLDIVYTFHKKCLTNMRVFEDYLLQLRSACNVSAELTVVLDDVKNNALRGPEDANEINSEDIHADIDNINYNIGHLECVEVKQEVDEITTDIVKHELPLSEIKHEMCTDMEDNNSRLDNKLSEKIVIYPILENDGTNQEKSKNLNKYELIDHVYENERSYEICEKRFTENFILSVHKQTHTETKEKQHECVVCKKTFRLRFQLNLHQRIHTETRPYKCEICNKKFTEKSNLSRHKQIHRTERPFKCSICEKRFNRSFHLFVHKRIHTGEKPFECDICQKRFNESNEFTNHKRIHSKEKPFECNICGKRFNRSSVLIVHKRIHTGEKPFECNICEKRFNRRDNLIRHIQTHTGEKPFGCNICEKRFNRSSDLIVHNRVHSGEKPFKCDMCEKRFNHSSGLVTHKRIHTGEKLFECIM